MKQLGDGGYAISDLLNISGSGSGYFIFARGWLLEIISLISGEFYFYSDGKEVRPKEGRFGVYYPRFSIVKSRVVECSAKVTGVGSVEWIDELPSAPFIFETGFEGDFTHIGEALDVLASGRNRKSIEVNTGPSLLSIQAKRLIDENYLIFPSLGKIAARLGVSHEHMSRQFKRDFGLSPSEYLHNLRVSEATHRLSAGEEIVDISLEVGYNDLSRFYKQFRKTTATSPAACRTLLSAHETHEIH